MDITACSTGHLSGLILSNYYLNIQDVIAILTGFVMGAYTLTYNMYMYTFIFLDSDKQLRISLLMTSNQTRWLVQDWKPQPLIKGQIV